MNQLGKVPNVEDSTLQKASQIKENTTTRGIPDDMFSLSAKELSTFNSLVSSQKGFSASMNTNKNTQFVKKKLEQQKKLQTCVLFSHFQIVFYWTKIEFSKTDHSPVTLVQTSRFDWWLCLGQGETGKSSEKTVDWCASELWKTDQTTELPEHWMVGYVNSLPCLDPKTMKNYLRF